MESMNAFPTALSDTLRRRTRHLHLYQRCHHKLHTARDGQDRIYIYIYIYVYIFTHTHVYMVNVRHFWQRNHRAYGHVRYKYTVLANPTHSSVCCCLYPASRVGQNHMCTPYMTVCLVISLPKTPYIYRIYVCMHGFGQPYLLSSS